MKKSQARKTFPSGTPVRVVNEFTGEIEHFTAGPIKYRLLYFTDGHAYRLGDIGGTRSHPYRLERGDGNPVGKG